MVKRLSFLRSAQVVPAVHQANFRHLYLDIAWWGVLNGSAILFLSVYCARLGASAEELGWLSSAPALVNLIFSIPAGILTQRWKISKSTAWSALLTRLFYLPMAIFPFFLSNDGQIWAFILTSVVMSITGTVAAVIGNAFFAEATPPEFRASVVGMRNALNSGVTFVTSLIAGQILQYVPFPYGYQIVFAMGFVGAMVSAYHLFQVRPLGEAQPKELTPPPPPPSLRLDILRTPFLKVMGMLFLFQFSVMLLGPVQPLYQVKTLGLSDQTISLSTGIFYIVNFAASLQTTRINRRFNFKEMTGYGLVIAGAGLILFWQGYSLPVYLSNAVFTGIGWAIINGGMLNYVLISVPENDRPAHLAWYNMTMNAAALCGTVGGAAIASHVGLSEAMLTIIVLRILCGLVISRLG